MDSSFRHLGLMLVCEVCEGEVELPEADAGGTGICRHCGIAFTFDSPYAAGSERRRA